jgi:hypothetical protein
VIIEVLLMMLLFGLGVFSVGFWASRKLRSIDAQTAKSQVESEKLRPAANPGASRTA